MFVFTGDITRNQFFPTDIRWTLITVTAKYSHMYLVFQLTTWIVLFTFYFFLSYLSRSIEFYWLKISIEF